MSSEAASPLQGIAQIVLQPKLFADERNKFSILIHRIQACRLDSWGVEAILEVMNPKLQQT